MNPLLRYSRQLSLIGEAGQLRLRNARVLCVGVGGLGCPLAQYLVAAGIGNLGLVDADRVDLTNLQRQVLFCESDIGQLKVEVAQHRLQQMNAEVAILTYPVAIASENAPELLESYDIVVDASDNYPTRYLLNDVCYQYRKPLVSASVFQFQGQVGVFNTDPALPCYRCLYPEPPPAHLMPNCAEAGVLGVLPGVMASLQAAEVLKWVLGIGDSLAGRLLTFDALDMKFTEYPIRQDPDCPLCCHQDRLSDRLSMDAPLCANPTEEEISVEQLMNWLSDLNSSVQLLDVREEWERAQFHIGGEFLPLSQFDPEKLGMDSQQLTVVYCHAGYRSLQAARLLRASGYVRIYSLKGGMSAWQDQSNRLGTHWHK